MDKMQPSLLQRLRDLSDTGAWVDFDRTYRPMLTAYAHARGLSAADAEDVAQQCAQAVVEQIERYEHLASFKAWLRSIAEHKVADVFRGRRREVQADSDMLSRHAGPPATRARSLSWTTADVRRCAEAVSREVAPTTFAAFVGYALERRPVREVAHELGMTPNQVYVAKHRIVARIRRRVEALTGNDEVTRA